MHVNLRGKKFLFFIFCYEKIGFGHFKRCLILARYVKLNRGEVYIILVGDKKSFNLINKCDLNFKFFNIENFNSSKPLLFYSLKYFDYVFLDIFNNDFYKYKNYLHRFVETLTKKNNCLISFPDPDRNSLSFKFSKINSNLLIVPYVNKILKKTPKLNMLLGPKYTVFDKNLKYNKQKVFSKKRNKVLITTGGADPNLYTLKILKIIDDLEKKMEIKVIIGPLFTEKMIKKIHNQAIKSNHKIVIIKNCIDLKHHMNWCDFSIATSGLTKYELAATGTPSILFSIDEFHNNKNFQFVQKKTCLDLGVGISKLKLKKAISNFIENKYLLNIMSSNGLSLVDKFGIKRIFSELIRIKNAKRNFN